MSIRIASAMAEIQTGSLIKANLACYYCTTMPGNGDDNNEHKQIMAVYFEG